MPGALKPFGEYGHRVVLDLYSLTPPDPLMALLDGERNGRAGGGAEALDKSTAAPEKATTILTEPANVSGFGEGLNPTYATRFCVPSYDLTLFTVLKISSA